MEEHALVKAISTLLVEIERVRLTIVSRAAKLEDFNHKTRHLTNFDALIEMAAQNIRKEMREVLRDVEELGGKFQSLHGHASADARDQAGRLVASARTLLQTMSNLSADTMQVHNNLRSSRFGVLGWNIHHDAREAEEIASRIVKTCQRVMSSGTD